ncbi:MAG: FRG domain-containing protein [Nitrospira sp.]|nr:FRG domain-containing protein [Nitrospira sp.]
MGFDLKQKEYTFKTWQEFCLILDELKEEHKKLYEKSIEGLEVPGKPWSILYRGQSNKDWLLQSTLLRFTNSREYSAHEYFHLIFLIKHEIETFMNQSWEISNEWFFEELKARAHKKEYFLFDEAEEFYRYLIYLRQFGFPSPLLDWSKSPYIAAYFAFREKPEKPPDYVSVFAYLETAGDMKYFSGDGPYFTSLGEFYRNPQRHFLQNCQYTMSIEVKEDSYFFISHEEVFNSTPRTDDYNPDQDLLWKFNIPYSEREMVLKYFDQFNLNAYSLFQTGEGLMETMADRIFFFK